MEIMDYFINTPLSTQPLTLALLVGLTVYAILTIIRLYFSYKHNQHVSQVYSDLVQKYEIKVISKGKYHSEVRKIREEIVKLDPFFDEEAMQDFRANSKNTSNKTV